MGKSVLFRLVFVFIINQIVNVKNDINVVSFVSWFIKKFKIWKSAFKPCCQVNDSESELYDIRKFVIAFVKFWPIGSAFSHWIVQKA